jgi:2-polyprenyl-3-methyl-5-hydroxy-6-metoxy-1,4-benzoquinol methylase
VDNRLIASSVKASTDNPQQQKWNRRYRQSDSANTAAAVLNDNRHLLLTQAATDTQGQALDLACGLGGNALLLARHGFNTQAWDLSDVAITKLQALADLQQLPLQACCIDLDQHPLPPASFDVISVSGFLDRALCPNISAALKPGGMLFYQTHTRAKATAEKGPSNPSFCLRRGELLQLFDTLIVVVYREEFDCGDLQQGLRNQAYLVARKLA